MLYTAAFCQLFIKDMMMITSTNEEQLK